jgi:hypothetical protein
MAECFGVEFPNNHSAIYMSFVFTADMLYCCQGGGLNVRRNYKNSEAAAALSYFLVQL